MQRLRSSQLSEEAVLAIRDLLLRELQEPRYFAEGPVLNPTQDQQAVIHGGNSLSQRCEQRVHQFSIPTGLPLLGRARSSIGHLVHRHFPGKPDWVASFVANEIESLVANQGV